MIKRHTDTNYVHLNAVAEHFLVYQKKGGGDSDCLVKIILNKLANLLHFL